ncbi:sigma-70 family RNA polymerase sigma factor [Phragmitibacter flavus]|uniref:Sigma-70 family RNA polymerase sigma factor n=1 Tax=Phragmitibacter flavus TaxID=2576071 RepID=A0A5R8KAW9_9BACT|nr:ECF-type sigma factor [Phragmitibacter flavus]TLD69065.1 sigma-70 family RNA polymerase sigma factor [Phragmitibacter flavus]
MKVDISLLLERLQTGEVDAEMELMNCVYFELKKIAAKALAGEQREVSLMTTDLVHEAWVRLLDQEGRVRFKNNLHFFGAAAEAMRRILVDRARRRSREKHGGKLVRIGLDDVEIEEPAAASEILDINDALEKLDGIDSRKAGIVRLRYFAGLGFEEIAAVTQYSLATVQRDWAYARAWLKVEIDRSRK